MKWENGGIENSHSFEEKVIEHHMDMLDEDDFLEHGPLSTFTADMSKIIPPMGMDAEEMKHSEYRARSSSIDRVDIDIESCIHSSTSSDVDLRDELSINIQQQLPQLQEENKDEEELLQASQDEDDEEDDDDVSEDSTSTVDTQIKEEQRDFVSKLHQQYEYNGHHQFNGHESYHHNHNHHNNHHNNGHHSNGQHKHHHSNGHHSHKSRYVDDDTDSITLRLKEKEDAKARRNSMITLQKERMLRNKRERRKSAVLSSQKSDLMEYNQAICQIEQHKRMISLDEHNSLKEQLIKWQSKAHRWQDMANRHERNHETTELKLQQKELKYKSKIRDQQNEISTLNKLLKKRELELEQKIIELRQIESASNMTIQELLTYKNTNEMRKKNSYIDGTLWKFTGDGMNNIKFNKAPKLKYVMYVPTRKKLYYSDSTQDDADTKLVNVTHITHRNQDIMSHLPDKYKNTWIKIIGQS